MKTFALMLALALSDKPQEVVATAYTARCQGCSGITASGKTADYRKRYIAANWNWPIGTCVLVELDGKWVRYTVQDRGPVKSNHIDLLVRTTAEAREFGRQRVRVKSCPKKK